MARNLYDKLMTKYESNPDDPMSKFTKPHAKNSVKDAKSTIARVKEALLKGKKILNIANILDAECKSMVLILDRYTTNFYL